MSLRFLERANQRPQKASAVAVDDVTAASRLLRPERRSPPRGCSLPVGGTGSGVERTLNACLSAALGAARRRPLERATQRRVSCAWFRSLAWLATPFLHRTGWAIALLLGAIVAQAGGTLRVCADPDNLPFSAADGSGFENRIAQIVARAMDREVAYYWLPDRRGFIRKTLGAGECDVVMGVPVSFERTLATPPYYRASYVLVYRAQALHDLSSLDDPRLARLRIGVALVGNDLAATPPALALAERGHLDNVTGFPMFGDGPVGQRIVAAVDRGTLDVGVLWGPQAGYFARRAQGTLTVAPITGGTSVPDEFAIGIGVRRGDHDLQRALTQALARVQPQIDAVLDEYAVPRLPLAPAQGSGS